MDYEVASYLQRETDFLPWMLIFQFVRNKISKGYENISSVKINLMDIFVKRVGSDDNPGDSVFERFVRLLTFLWASKIGNYECEKILNQILTRIEENPDLSLEKLPRNTFFWVSPALLISRVTKICRLNEPKTKSTVLQHNWPNDPNIFIHILQCSEEQRHMYDYRIIYHTIVRKHADNDVLLEYLLENINKVRSTHFTAEHIIEIIINSVHSLERLERVRNFVNFNINPRKIKGVTPAIYKRKVELKKKMMKEKKS